MDLQKVDFKKLQSLTPDEMIIAGVLAKAAKEAEEAKKLIYDAFTFRIGEKEKVVWKNGHSNYETITRDGRWTGHYQGNGSYVIDCQKESMSIYSFFYAQTLLEEGYVGADDMASGNTTYAEMRAIATYFRAFLDRTKKQMNKNDSDDANAEKIPAETADSDEQPEEEFVPDLENEDELEDEELEM